MTSLYPFWQSGTPIKGKLKAGSRSPQTRRIMDFNSADISTASIL